METFHNARRDWEADRAVAECVLNNPTPKENVKKPTRRRDSVAPHPRHWLGFALVVGLSGCTVLPPAPPAHSPVAACLELYARADRAIGSAAAQDAGAHRIPGFPHLRSNRFLASFADELQDHAATLAWLQQLREQDAIARRLELRNVDHQAHEPIPWQVLQECGQQLLSWDLRTPARLERLREAVQVPSAYSTLARVAGLYPLAVPFMKLGIADFREQLTSDYASPLTKPMPPRELQHWSPGAALAETPLDWHGVSRDALGIPQIDAAQWQALMIQHAPDFSIETAGSHDLPGSPYWASDASLAFSTDDPALYVWRSHTRHAGAVLVQLNYLLWFERRPATSALDPYAGWLDGLIWRVTLGPDGKALLYDSIHACGCYHYFYPVADRLRPRADVYWREATLLPQGAVAPGPVSLRVASGTHYLRRVLPRGPTPASHPLPLRAYAELQSLSIPSGGHRSLFSETGIIRDTERLERFWLWPSGVRNPGAMRQNGHHATAFIGQRHFDEAFLIDRLFKPADD